jgi:TetR/AcrR family transcriptional repressor of lmrAB and yxaGH operons
MPRPDRHRAALISATAQLLRRRGYAATGLGDILSAADATNGSLYHHFPGGKEDLALAALEASSRAVEDALRTALDDDPDVSSALHRWLDGPIAALQADPRDGCPVAPVALEATPSSEALRAAAAAAFSRWRALLEAALARTRDPATATRQARVVLAAIEGALLLDRTAQSTEHLTALRDEIDGLLTNHYVAEAATSGAPSDNQRGPRAAARRRK